MVLSCLKVIGRRPAKAAKVLVVSKPKVIFYTRYGKS